MTTPPASTPPPPKPLACCSRCDTPLERGDLRCSICAQIAPVRQGATDTVALTILRCDGCGAALRYDVRVQAPSCGFCGSVTHLETIDDPMEQTSLHLPFTVSGEDARAALRQWLGTLGFFKPGDLMTASRIEELQPLWWTCWVFDADALVSWTADSDAGSGRSSWAPHAGQVRMTFDDIHVSASRGLTQAETDFLGHHYDYASGRRQPEGIDDADSALVEQFDVQRSAARRRVVQAIHAHATGTVEAEFIPGNRFRNVNIDVLLRGLVTRRLAAPAWVLAYRYDDKLYRVVISGQDARAIRGDAPTSIWRVLGVICGVLLALALLAGIVAALA